MPEKKLVLGSIGSVILAGCIYRFTCIALDVGLQSIETPVLTVCEVALLIFVSSAACISVHMSLILWSDHHSIFSVILVYSLHMISGIVSKLMIRSFEKRTKNFRETQETLLLDGLKFNANTVYGKDFKFDEIHSLDDFKTKHPVTTYSHYQKYIDCICNGEQNVMTKDKTIRLTLTSGTTGTSKKIPYTKTSLGAMQRSSMYSYGTVASSKRFTAPSPLQRSMLLMCAPIRRPDIAGIPVGPLSMIDPSHKKFLVVTTSPPAAFDICTEFESSYVHFLFGISDRNLYKIDGTFTPMLLKGFHILKQHWREMLNDMSKCRLNPILNIPDEIRKELDMYVKTRNVPDRIQSLRKEFEKGFDGIAKRIWPKIQLVSAIGMGNSEEELRNTYLKGVPIIAPGYASTEGYFGVNISLTFPPLYTLMPSSVLYEFIPVEQSDNDIPDTVFGDAVKIGEEYELLVTNPTCGLYRFRFGDVIKVVDFYNKTPVIDFQYRYGQLMNLRGEKVDEASMYASIMECVKRWSGQRLVEFACVESTMIPDSDRKAGPDHYVMFIEIEETTNDTVHVLTAEEKIMLDTVLCEQSFTYKSFRDKNSIGPMDVRQVKQGGFSGLKNYIINNSTTSVSQFKQPRKLKSAGAVEYLLEKHC